MIGNWDVVEIGEDHVFVSEEYGSVNEDGSLVSRIPICRSFVPREISIDAACEFMSLYNDALYIHLSPEDLMGMCFRRARKCSI